MLRRLFTVLSALSLLLCAAVAVLWVRSYRSGERLSRESYAIVDGQGRGTRTEFTSAAGRLGWRKRWSATDHPEFAARVAQLLPGGRSRVRLVRVDRLGLPPSGQVDWRRGFLGIGVGRRTYSEPLPEMKPPHPLTYSLWRREVWLVVPYPYLALLTGLLPAAWIASAIRRRSRRTRNHCPACGYDLRATPDRCPECGLVPAAGRSPPAV